ncbi:hypothetical protein BJ875DRAFT_448489 [Amylocarpus encephaloides]|uniref:Uncharacterized protein n=1 Tax=Amylocarpus encephaloides TaxID=45428 RepID=A0A9P7YT62_9HELO|nr:hypothetical protein BJ875DRAFT_448489 [Amylocarpus encephaloides]
MRRRACTLPIAGVTAWMALNEMRPLGKKGEGVLRQGTGGAGDGYSSPLYPRLIQRGSFINTPSSHHHILIR